MERLRRAGNWLGFVGSVYFITVWILAVAAISLRGSAFEKEFGVAFPKLCLGLVIAVLCTCVAALRSRWWLVSTAVQSFVLLVLLYAESK